MCGTTNKNVIIEIQFKNRNQDHNAHYKSLHLVQDYVNSLKDSSTLLDKLAWEKNQPDQVSSSAEVVVLVLVV